ncbi:MAG: type II toxin-antitoxin system VapC family toxin [Byssovorax sp.]
MIIPDVNLLLYAEIDAYPVHASARRWWESILSGDRQVGLVPACIFGFLRISTNRRVFTEPLAVSDAIERVNRWLSRPNVTMLTPGSRHLEIAFHLLRQLGTGSNLTTDVQIAAHAIEVNGEVHSNDRDFGRFPGLRWISPITG